MQEADKPKKHIPEHTEPFEVNDISPAQRKAYWRKNLLVIAFLLSIWFLVSLVAGAIFVDELNSIRFPSKGFPFGFWISQQGSIIVFVLITLAYWIIMNRIDHKLHMEEPEDDEVRDFEI